MMDDLAQAAGLATLASLRPSPRMPVLFIGHGSPMNAVGDNRWRRGWQALGAEFGHGLPQPQLILCISPHWITRGWWLTGMAAPKTIHDFGGFPQALFDQQYPAPGAPAFAHELSRSVFQPQLQVDEGQWGLDHGTWSVLKPMFPQARIPVVQLSIDYDKAPAEHFALGRLLKPLRERGVLIVGSGNIVHNLAQVRREVPDGQAYDWAVDFDQQVKARVDKGDLAGLRDFQAWGPSARQAQPTHDHYLPLLHAAGAVDPGERVRYLNDSFQLASLSMRSMVWHGA